MSAPYQIAFLLVSLLALVNAAADWSADMDPARWNKYSRDRLDMMLKMTPNLNVAKNVVFFLGDGMGITTVTAGRIRKGQQKGKNGEEEVTSMEDAEFVGFSKTYNIDAQTADSAGTATAYLSGVKTRIGVIGVDGRAYDCKTSLNSHVDSILQWAYKAGKSVGIVTTTRVTHATPAGCYGHVIDRDWEALDGDKFKDSDKAEGCTDLASQLVDNHTYINVIFAGGRRKFVRTTDLDPRNNKPGDRIDGRNLIEEWQAKMSSKKAKYVSTYADFQNLKPNQYDHVLGLLAHDHLEYEHDRVDINPPDEPSVAEMTEKAIQLLSTNPKGFFLLVEGGKIDHGHHESVARRALDDYVAFDQAIAKAKSITNKENTLTVVTADHSHVFTMGGYAVRGNEILGVVVSKYGNFSDDASRKTFTALNYGNGPGGLKALRTTNLTNADTVGKNYAQESPVFKASETHGGEDVPVFAVGPMSYLFDGVYEQSHIAHAMAYSACIGAYDTADCRGNRGAWKPNSASGQTKIKGLAFLMSALIAKLIR